MADKQPKPIVLEGSQLGWVTDYTSQNVPVDGAPGQYKFSFGVSPYRPGKRGSISPAEIFGGAGFTDTGSKVNTLPRAVANDINFTTSRSAVLLGGAATVAPRVVLFDNTNSQTSFHDITPVANFTTLPTTGFWGEDIIYYPSLNGSLSGGGTYADFAYYTWNDSANGYIGQYQFGTTTYIDNFMGSGTPTLASGSASTLQAAVPHPGCVGADKIAYWCNGQYVASYDGTIDQSGANGTFNSYALNLGAGWIAVDVCEYPGYAIAVLIVKLGTTYQPSSTNYATEARVVIWDGFSLDFNQLYKLDDWYGTTLFTVQGTLFAWTQGLNGTTKAKYLPVNASEFVTVWEALTSIVGNAPLPNQVEYFNNLILWPGDTTTNEIFALAPNPDGSWGLHTPYYATAGTGLNDITQCGFLKNINSNILFLGFKGAASGTGAGITGLFGDGSSNSSLVEGLANFKMQFRSIVYYPGYKQTIAYIKAYFYQFDGDTSMYISLLPQKSLYAEDGSGNPIGDVLAWTIDDAHHPNIGTTLTASTRELARSTIASDVSNFWLILRFTNSDPTATAPIIDRLEIYIENVDNP